MCQLVAAESERSFVLSLFALRRKYFCRLLSLRVLDFDVGSSFVGYYLIGSTYAEDSCDSDVLSCDRCNTQLRVGFFLLLDFLA